MAFMRIQQIVCTLSKLIHDKKEVIMSTLILILSLTSFVRAMINPHRLNDHKAIKCQLFIKELSHKFSHSI